MASLTDDRWSIKKETTYGTADLTAMRFYPWLEVDGSYDNRRRESEGLQAGGGARTVLGTRTTLPLPSAGGADIELTTKVELESKGLGVLCDIALGVSTVTAITGGSQQVFHRGLSTSYLPSATIQVVKVRNDGTERVETYAGCTPVKVTIEQPSEAYATMEVEWAPRTVVTNLAAFTPIAYPSAPTPMDSTFGAVSLDGAVVVPTTTALGTVATAFGDMKSWKLEIEHAIDDPDDTRVIGSRNRPIAHNPSYTFEGEAEFTGNQVADLVFGGGLFGWQQTWTTPEVLGAGFAQAQLLIPKIGLMGDLPQVAAGERRMISLKGKVYNDGTNRDIYFTTRTADTAL